MFVKITTSGDRRYVQLVESFRDEQGRVKKRTLATLGRLDQVDGGLDTVINGLLRITGRAAVGAPPGWPTVTFESTRTFGEVWVLTELWNTLGLSALRGVFGKTRHRLDIEALLRLMVFNRLCDPESKLGVLRWLETVALPGMALPKVTHQHLLRSLDALIDHQAAVARVVAGVLRPMIAQELAVVFYDLTTVRAEGASTPTGDVRQWGMAKEGLIAQQFLLGIVQTVEGLPLDHQVVDGNTAETTTLLPTLNRLLTRFPTVRRVILIADRGLLSLDNLAALQAIRLASGQALEFILAVPGRRYAEFADVLATFAPPPAPTATAEVIGEVAWQGLRLVVAHDPVRAAQETQRRQAQIQTLTTQADQWAGKLDRQDAGVRQRGRQLSDRGATARFYQAVSEARLSRIIKVDLKGKLFSYQIDESARAQAELLDGKLLLVTNTPGLTPPEIVGRYKALADIERGFRVLKSELAIGPVYHRLPDRIRAHAWLCFLALILYRVMRQRLKTAQIGLSPERALERLQRIQYHQIRLNATHAVTGLSTLHHQQTEVLKALNIKKPIAAQPLTLL
ncbi:MAG: IS1634 family transposase [Comamonadaceae bacterium]|nr:IS1634 family transposase [Comamonadaceae bacterium]MCK7577129.1 IS1634 family transposase [Chromatiales bacterium]